MASHKEMIFNESIRYLEKLCKLRPDLVKQIDKLIKEIKDPTKIHRINEDSLC